jgi:hypothetical protein
MTLRLAGSTSGYTEIDAPAVAGNNSIALPTGNGSAYQVLRNGATAGSLEYADKIVSGTAQASTSGTSIDFIGIPSWVKRITVMFSGVSTSGTSNYQVQIGSSTFTTSGYLGSSGNLGGSANFTAGFGLTAGAATVVMQANMQICLIGSNSWVASHAGGRSDAASITFGGGAVSLGGTLDRVRITTVNGTDTFDAGTINILYE